MLLPVFLIAIILVTSGYVTTIHFAYAKHGGSSSNCTGNETCPTPTPTPPSPPPPSCPPGEHLKNGVCKLNRGCETVGNGTIFCTKTKTRHVSSGSHYSGLTQIASNVTDYPNNNPNVIQVHVTTAKKDIIGSYHVTGEIMNVGNDVLSSVQVTVHFYDTSGNLVADSTCCYTTPTDIEPGHTSTFDSFAMSNQISGTPVSFRLSYDWSAPPPATPSQSASNFTVGNMPSAVKSSPSSSPSITNNPSSSFVSSNSKGGLQQIQSQTTDYPGNDPSVIQVHVTSAKKDIAGAWHVIGEITNVGNDTLNTVEVTIHFYDASNQLIAVSTCCDTTPLNIEPGHTATFDSFVTPDQITGKPTSYRLSYDWS